jgi:hypothetical protein
MQMLGRTTRRGIVALTLALGAAAPLLVPAEASAATLSVPSHAVGATKCLVDGAGMPILRTTVFTEMAYLFPPDERIWTAVRVQVWSNGAWRFVDAPMDQDNYTRNYVWTNPNGWDLRRTYDIYLPGWAVRGKYFRLVGDFGYNPPDSSTTFGTLWHEGHSSTNHCYFA